MIQTCRWNRSKKKGINLESIQSSTSPDPEYQLESNRDSQLEITNESQEVSSFPAGGHKASINRRARRHNKTQDKNNIKDPQKKYRLGKVSKNFLLEDLNRFHRANLILSSDVDQDT